MARIYGSFCTLLLVWLCALGAGPAQKPATPAVAIRSGMELALRDVADTPLLASRALVTRAASARSVERHTATPLSWFIGPRRAPIRRTERAARMALDRQATAHADRPRWRAYDAAAPPALSRIAR